MVRVIDHPSTGSHTELLGYMSLRPEREAVPTARRWFSRFTTSLRVTRQDDCLLLLSELVTNALTYGRGDLEWHIHVEWWREGRTLHVAVHSPGDPEPLRVRHAGENDETGRGLFLVDCLADSWRAAPSHFGGIRVSFALEGWPPRPTSTAHRREGETARCSADVGRQVPRGTVRSFVRQPRSSAGYLVIERVQ